MSESITQTKLPRRSRILPLLGALTALFVFASVASAQPGVRKANRLTFDINSNREGVISQDARTLTTQLPQYSSINDSYRGRHIYMALTYQSAGSGLPEARFVQAAASDRHVTCDLRPTRNPAPYRFGCSADATWLRNLRTETRIKIEVGGAGVDGKLSATWIIRPQAPLIRKRLPR